MAKKKNKKVEVPVFTRLDNVCKTLEHVNNVIVVCGAALQGQDAEQDREIAGVLRVNASNPLFATMMELSLLATQLRDRKIEKT